ARSRLHRSERSFPSARLRSCPNPGRSKSAAEQRGPADRRAACLETRSLRTITRRRSTAAQGLHFFRELLAALDPLLFLLSLRLHDCCRGPADESLVAQAHGQRLQLILQLFELGTKLPTFLRQVDETAEGNDHFAPVREHGV